MLTKLVHQPYGIQENSRWVVSRLCRRSIVRSRNASNDTDFLLTSLLYYIFSCAGIEGDIYYIRDGEVKLNAVNFNMTVPSRVNCLRFIWYSKRIPSTPMVSLSIPTAFEQNFKLVNVGIRSPYSSAGCQVINLVDLLMEHSSYDDIRAEFVFVSYACVRRFARNAELLFYFSHVTCGISFAKSSK